MDVHSSGSIERSTHIRSKLYGSIFAAGNSIDRRTPRALPDASSTPLGQLVDQFGTRVVSERTTLNRSEPATVDLLNGGNRLPECVQIALSDRWEQRHDQEVGYVFYLAQRGRRKLTEGLDLRFAAHSFCIGRHSNDAAPAVGDWKTCQERCDAVGVFTSAAFDDEAPGVEQPRADR